MPAPLLLPPYPLLLLRPLPMQCRRPALVHTQPAASPEPLGTKFSPKMYASRVPSAEAMPTCPATGSVCSGRPSPRACGIKGQGRWGPERACTSPQAAQHSTVPAR